MRRLIITEEEKRNILNKHINGYKPKNNYNIYEEKRNILKLMNLTEGVNPVKITEIFGFEKLAKILTPEMSEAILKNIGDYSAGLKKLGINSLEELDAASKAWQQTEMSNLKVILEGSDLMSAFLRSKSLVGEISLNVISRQAIEIDGAAAKALEDLSNSMGTYANKTGIEQEIGVGVKISDDISSDALAKSESEIVALETKLEKVIEKTEKELLEGDIYIKTLPFKQQAAYAAGQKTMRDIIEKLKALKIRLAEQKAAIQTAKEQYAYLRTIEGDVIEFGGKTWKAYEMGGLRKLLIRWGVDSYPFIYAVCTYIRQFFTTKCLSDVMFENLAKLQQLEKMLSESAGGASEAIKKEIALYSRETSSLITMLNKKQLVINPNYRKTAGDWFAEIVGYGGTDLANTWKTIVNILNEQVKKGVITDAEMTQMLDNIKYAYANVSEVDGKVVYNIVGDSGNLRGMFKFKEDLVTQAKNAGIDLGNTVKLAAVKSESNAVTEWQQLCKYFYDSVYKPAAGITKQKFWKAVGGVFIREFIFGLPLNIRTYLSPLTKFGFNFTGIAVLYLKLLFAKTMASFVMGAIGAGAYHILLMLTISFTGLDQKQCEKLAWADFNEDMDKYKNMEIINILSLGGIDIKTEYGEREVNKMKYKENVTKELGPLKIRFKEISEELFSVLRTNPDTKEVQKYIINKTKELETKTEEKLRVMQTEAFYTLPEEQQETMSLIDEWNKVIDMPEFTKFTGNKEDLKSRLFVKAQFSGLPDLDAKISDAQKIKNALSHLDDYGYQICLCKKDLKYEEKPIKVGDETKIAKVPICKSFVRMIEYKPNNFIDNETLNSNPKVTGKLSPIFGKTGYIDGTSVLDPAPLSTQFYLLENFKKYLN
jgi:hypothetical protein